VGGRVSCRIVREEDRRKIGSRTGLAVSQPVREPTQGDALQPEKMKRVSTFLSKHSVLVLMRCFRNSFLLCASVNFELSVLKFSTF
jgi:hypothetical protein